MRLQKTLVETHEFPNGEIQAVLYDNDDKVVRIVMIDEEGMPILSESERKALGDELKRFDTQDPVKAHRSAVKRQQDEYQPLSKNDDEEDELVPEPTPFNNYASLMNRRAMGTPEKKIKYVQSADPKARMKPSPKPSPPKMFSMKDFTEEDIEEITARVLDRLSEGREEIKKSQPTFVDKFYKIMGVRKGLLTNLIGIGAIATMLPDKEQNRIDRMMEREMERAERMRDINNKRNSRRRR